MTRLALAFLLCSTLMGCVTYKWRDESFSSRQDAIAAVRKAQAETLAKIDPLPKPVAKSAKFIGVSNTLMLDRGTVGTNMEIRSYIAEAQHIQMKNVYDAMVKRNIFEKLAYVEGDGSDQTPTRDEAIIYFYLPDNKTGGYYFVSPTVKKTPVQFDRGNPDIAGRTVYLLDSVAALASIK